MDWKLRIEYLLEAGESIDSIATVMGVTPNAVREILAERTKSPRANAAMKLLSFRPDLFPAPEVTKDAA